MANVVDSSRLHVREVSRRLVKACSGDSSIVVVPPQVIAVSNLDLLDTDYPVSLVFVYPKPPSSAVSFADIVACFEAKLPSFLNHFFPLTGRVVTNPSTGLPEIHCNNEGAELMVGDAGGVVLSGLDLSRIGARIPMPFDKAVALSLQLVSFGCGGFSVSWNWSHIVGDGCATCMVVDMWSAFVRNGAAFAGGGVVPYLVDDRSAVFRPRSPPSYAPSFGDAYMVDTPEQHVNVLTNQTFAERLYFIAARDVERLRAAASCG
ncbi:hypothetical protein EJB05_12661, partial [Eragrostis curvula]